MTTEDNGSGVGLESYRNQRRLLDERNRKFRKKRREAKNAEHDRVLKESGVVPDE